METEYYLDFFLRRVINLSKNDLRLFTSEKSAIVPNSWSRE